MAGILQKYGLLGAGTALFPFSLLAFRESAAAGLQLCHANRMVENG